MKRILSLLCWIWGIPLVILGVGTLVADFLVNPPTNILLFAGMLCVTAGIAGYVWRTKRMGEY